MAGEKKYTLEELEKKLTKKERIFSHEVIVDWNRSRAARAAGYSENTCAEIGYENMKKPHIIQYIDFIKEDLEKEAGISKLRNLRELSKIAYSSIEHLNDSWIELKEWDEIRESNPDALAAVESKETKVLKKNIGTGEDPEIVDVEFIKLKLYPKIQAITEINKMMGYNAPDKIDHRSSDGSMTPNKQINISIDGKEIDLST